MLLLSAHLTHWTVPTSYSFNVKKIKNRSVLLLIPSAFLKSILKFCLYLFILAGVFVAAWVFSGCRERGYSLVEAGTAHCGGFPCWGAPALGQAGSSRCGPQALERRLQGVAHPFSCSGGMWGLSHPGIESVSPTLAGAFFTPEPLGSVC